MINSKITNINNSNLWKIISYLLFILTLIFVSNISYAEGEAGILSDITEKIQHSSYLWHENLRPTITYLFWGLATISLTYQGIAMTLKGADFPEIMSELVKLLLIFGFWIWIITHSVYITQVILQSFNVAANLATGENTVITPGGVINHGIDLAELIIDNSGFWDKIIYGLLALLLLICYCYMAANLFVVLIESYIITGMGIILLGFAGSPWTSDIAKKYLFFAFSVGVKIFAMVIVIKMGENFVRDSLKVSSEIKEIFAIVGVIFMLAYLTNRVPAMAQSMVSGASSGSFGVDATGGMKAAVAGLAAAGAAMKVAASQMGKGASNAASSAAGGGKAQSPTTAASNMGGAGGNTGGGSGSGENDKSAIPTALSQPQSGGATPTPTPAAAGASENASASSEGSSSSGGSSSAGDNSGSESKSGNNSSNANASASSQSGSAGSKGSGSSASNLNKSSDNGSGGGANSSAGVKSSTNGSESASGSSSGSASSSVGGENNSSNNASANNTNGSSTTSSSQSTNLSPEQESRAKQAAELAKNYGKKAVGGVVKGAKVAGEFAGRTALIAGAAGLKNAFPTANKILEAEKQRQKEEEEKKKAEEVKN